MQRPIVLLLAASVLAWGPLAARAQDSSLQLRSLAWSGEQSGLRLRLDLRLAEEPLQALEQGVALPFVIEWRACPERCGPIVGVQRLELRHAPLLQRYLLWIEDQPPRQFAFRAALFGAFEQPPALSMPRHSGWQVRVRLEHAKLPAPLRLPARLQQVWQLDSGWQEAPS
jgi:hypothetical protein